MVVLAARKGPGWKRWQWVPMIFEWLTRDVAFIHTDQLGDLKRLATPPKPLFEIPEGTIVGASTRPGDEKRLLDAWEKLDTPRPKLILAPRHLHRVDAILALVQPHRASLRSNGLQPEDDIWILDTHGELAGVVAHAHIVMIGGTFDPDIGGHSPAEAALGHAHLIRGPYTAANAATWRFTPLRSYSSRPPANVRSPSASTPASSARTALSSDFWVMSRRKTLSASSVWPSSSKNWPESDFDGTSELFSGCFVELVSCGS